ncbi:MAG: transposase [Janthinobacterium lividum]
MSKPLFADLLEAFASAVGAGPKKRVVLLLDNAGWHTLPNLAVPDGIKLVYLPPYSPELQPAEMLWTLVDEPIVNTFVPNLTKLIDTITERCSNLTKRQPEISSRTNFAWWPKNHAPA